MNGVAPWLVGEEARAYVEEDLGAVPLEEQANRTVQRARAVRVLGRETTSPLRAAVGVGAWLVGLVGVAALTYAAWHGGSVALRLVSAVVGVAAVAGSVLLGHQVWRAGRRVVDAFCWWTLLPERLPQGGAGADDWRASPVGDAVEARIFMLQGGRMVRVGLAVVAFLAPLTLLQQATQGSPRLPDTWPSDQTAALLVAVLGSLAISWPAGALTFGGQVRANSAHARRDPVSGWIKRKAGGH